MSPSGQVHDPPKPPNPAEDGGEAGPEPTGDETLATEAGADSVRDASILDTRAGFGALCAAQSDLKNTDGG